MAKAPTNGRRSQRERFEQAARDVWEEESESGFERRLKAVANGPTSTSAKKAPRSGKGERK